MSKTELTGGVFSDEVYAGIHEDGGVIKPVRRKTLAIPFPGVNLPQGVGPLDFPNLMFIPSKSPDTRGILALKTGKETFKPMFLLRKKVTITPKHYLRKANMKASPQVGDLVADLVRRSIVEGSK